MSEFGLGFVGSFEVVRPFSGHPDVGEIIPLTEINPRSAASLVERRHLRPIGRMGTIDQERTHWRGALRPYDEIAGPDNAAKGSELARLVTDAAAAEKGAVAAEKRASTLATQLAKAQAVVTGADEKADFAVVARALAETHVVGTIAREAEREATVARNAAHQAETTLTKTWAGVEAARRTLHGLIDGDLFDGKSGHKWALSWQALRDALDVPDQVAA